MKRTIEWTWRIVLIVGLGVLGAKAEAQAVAKKPMPTPRISAAAAVVGNKIYVLGGLSRQGRALATVEEYDPAKDSWTRRKSMPTARAMFGAAAIGSTIYVVGGVSKSGVLAVVEAYDVKSDRWRSVAPLPQGRWGVKAAEAGGKLLVLGGITGMGAARRAVNSVDVFDPAQNAWSAGKPLPVVLQSPALAVHDGNIFVLGGRIGAGRTGKATSHVYIWRTGAHEWTKGPSLLEARTGAAAAVVGSQLVLVGGAAGGTLLGRLEMLQLPEGKKWTRVDLALSTPRTGLVVAEVGGKIYAIGGATKQSPAGFTGVVEEITLR